MLSKVLLKQPPRLNLYNYSPVYLLKKVNYQIFEKIRISFSNIAQKKCFQKFFLLFSSLQVFKNIFSSSTLQQFDEGNTYDTYIQSFIEKTFNSLVLLENHIHLYNSRSGKVGKSSKKTFNHLSKCISVHLLFNNF